MSGGATLTVLRAGPRDLAQDGGRLAARGAGAPVGGAADTALRRLTQAVADGRDAPEAVCIEVALSGPTLRADGAPARVALGGVAGRITRADGATAPLPALRSATLAPGDTLQVGATAAALGYVCVAGGLDAPMVLGARATDLRAGFGGFRGRALRAGDAIPLAGGPPQGPERHAPPQRPREGSLRVIMGPQVEHFTDAALALFTAADWRVGSAVDRMGVRLEGPRLEHGPLGADMTSEGLTIGAVQVPGDGQPIVLGVESHTIGGYPKIAVVISADRDRLGQLRPGDTVRFQAVTLTQARAALAEADRALDAALAAVAPWTGDGAAVDEAALRAANLVSGVAHATAPRFPHALEEFDP